MWWIILSYVVGIIVGFIFANHKLHRKSSGSIRIDNSIPEDGPYLFLEMNSDPNALKDHKYVTLEVKFENFISQK